VFNTTEAQPGSWSRSAASQEQWLHLNRVQADKHAVQHRCRHEPLTHALAGKTPHLLLPIRQLWLLAVIFRGRC